MAALVHIGYALMLCALLARDILWLRALLVLAQSLLAAYAWHVGVPSIAWWNVAFVMINAVWVGRIVAERRGVVLPPDLATLHHGPFAALTAPELLHLWNAGRDGHSLPGTALTRQGTRPEALFFLTSGRVRIARGDAHIATLGAGDFVGEMSLLTGTTATADAIAIDDVTSHRWETSYLLDLRDRQPLLWTKIQSVLGRDIVAKIQRAERSG